MDLAAVRTAIAAALTAAQADGALAGVQILPKMSAQFIAPALMVAYPEEVGYHHTMQEGSRWVMVVMGIGGAGLLDEVAMDKIDGWLSDEGAESVMRILEEDQTLGGICDDVTVSSSHGYSVFNTEKGAYLGTDWMVELLSSTD